MGFIRYDRYDSAEAWVITWFYYRSLVKRSDKILHLFISEALGIGLYSMLVIRPKLGGFKHWLAGEIVSAVSRCRMDNLGHAKFSNVKFSNAPTLAT